MGPGLGYTDGYPGFYDFGGVIVLGLPILILLLAAAFAAGWRSAGRRAEIRRRRVRREVSSSLGKALDKALNANGEQNIVAARQLVQEVWKQLQPILTLSEPIIVNLRAVDAALSGRAPVAAPPRPPVGEPTATVIFTAPTGPTASSASRGGHMATASASTAHGGVEVIVPAHKASPHDQAPEPAERDMTVRERDDAVRTALLAFETFWRQSSPDDLIKNIQHALLDERTDGAEGHG
jgi:hypothetical protein